MKKSLITLLTLLSSASLHAAIIHGTGQITNISYTGTNPDSGLAGITDPTGLVNGAGLSATPTEANVSAVTHNNPFGSADNAWATNDPNGGFGNDFFASGGVQGTVVFEVTFDTTYTLYRMYTWSYDFDEALPNANNFKTVTINYGVGDFAGGTLTDVEFTAPANNVSSVADWGFGITADSIRFTVTDNWFDSNTIYQGGDRVASAEIAFSTIPEPGSIALVSILGLVSVFGLRRKRP